jgi:hypothetical protein
MSGEEQSTTATSPEQNNNNNTNDNDKKRSAYHYWHGDVDNKKSRGDVAPMPVHVALSSTKVEVDKVHYKPISKYSWCDNEKTVDIYVDWPELNADNVSVNFTAGTVIADVKESDVVVHRLSIKTSKSVNPEESKFRCKPAQLAIKLKKENVETWFDLEEKPSLSL